MRRSKFTSGFNAPPDARPEPNAWTTPAIFFSLIVISIFSNGNLHPRVLPVSEDSNLQQYIGVGLWAVVIVVSYFRRVLIRLAPQPGLLLALGIYAIAVASPLWSTNFMASLPKAAALAIVAFGAYRLTRTFDLDAIIDAVLFGQFFLCVASIAVALLIPDIGVLKTWQHAGQWNGIFYTKQNLGVLAAVFLFFSWWRWSASSCRARAGAAGSQPSRSVAFTLPGSRWRSRGYWPSRPSSWESSGRRSSPIS